MGEKSLAAVVLAAGKGARLNSPLAKVLQPLAGHPLLHHVLCALQIPLPNSYPAYSNKPHKL